MSRSALRPWLRNTLLVLGGAGVFVLGWQSLESILRADPFSKFGLTGQPLGAEAPGFWIMDGAGPDARPINGFGFNATVSDYARIGLLIK